MAGSESQGANTEAKDSAHDRYVYRTMSRAGARAYVRRRDLPALVPLWPHDLADENAEGIQRIVLKLARALRAERRRARASHWSYDLNRHLALMSAYRAERARLVRLGGAITRRRRSKETGSEAATRPELRPRRPGRPHRPSAPAPRNRSRE